MREPLTREQVFNEDFNHEQVIELFEANVDLTQQLAALRQEIDGDRRQTADRGGEAVTPAREDELIEQYLNGEIGLDRVILDGLPGFDEPGPIPVPEEG